MTTSAAAAPAPEAPARVSSAVIRMIRLIGGTDDDGPPGSLDSVRFGLPDPWPDHPGDGLTAGKVRTIILDAERGFPRRLCRLFGDVLRRDAHLRSIVGMRISAVVGKSWIIAPGGEEDADVRAATLLERHFRLIPNLRQTFRHWLRGVFYGWSITDTAWETDVDGVTFPAVFENLKHERTVFDVWGRPRIPVAAEAVPEGDGFTRPTVRAAPLPDSLEIGPGWIYAAPEEHDVAISGLLVPALWMSLFKTMDIRDLVVFNERFGLPFIIGTYTDNTPEDEKAVLVKTLPRIGRDGYAAMHESCKIETIKVEVSGTPDTVHLPAVAFFNAELSKLITGATLTSGEGTSAGSYALGRVHENVLFQYVLDDADWLGDIFQQQIGIPFLRWNNLPGMPPRLKINVVRESIPTERLAIFEGAKRLGIDVDPDQPRQELQLKPPKGGAKEPPPAPDPVPDPAGDIGAEE